MRYVVKPDIILLVNKIDLYLVNRGDERVGAEPVACSTGVNYPIVWHTHPKTSKYYPSVVDIVKILKHSSKISYIFVPYGFWKLECPSVYSGFREMLGIKKEDYDNADKITQRIYFLLQNFYRATQKGKDFNKELVDGLVSQLNDQINKAPRIKNNDFKITWTDKTDSAFGIFS